MEANARDNAPDPKPRPQSPLEKAKALAGVGANDRSNTTGPKPKPPSPWEKAKALADAGDLEGLIQAIAQVRPVDGLSQADVDSLLFHAAQVASRGDPREFTDGLLQMTTSFTAFLMARVETALLKTPGPKDLAGTYTALPTEEEQKLLALRDTLQRQLIDIGLARARITRVYKLAQRRRPRRRRSRPGLNGSTNGTSQRHPGMTGWISDEGLAGPGASPSPN
jgi:hypothetical protein